MSSHYLFGMFKLKIQKHELNYNRGELKCLVLLRVNVILLLLNIMMFSSSSQMFGSSFNFSFDYDILYGVYASCFHLNAVIFSTQSN